MNMLLILLLSCICYHSSLASTYSSYEEAKVKAESLKKEFGYGVSTEVIIQNALSYDINFSDADHFEGYFHSKPPSTIPAGKYGVFLHRKTSGSATGSIGAVGYQVQNGDKVFFGWYVPYWGKNYVGVEVVEKGSYPGDLYKLTYQTRHSRTDDNNENIKGYAKLAERLSAQLVFFKVSENNK